MNVSHRLSDMDCTFSASGSSQDHPGQKGWSKNHPGQKGWSQRHTSINWSAQNHPGIKVNTTGIKRSRPNFEMSIEDSVEPSLENWPRFLVVKSLDENRTFAKVSPFVISKALKGLAGEPKDVRKLASGELLVECAKKAHSDNLLKSTVFADIPVDVSAHKTLNYCKGVVRSRELGLSTEEEIMEELSSQNVSSVRQITIKREGEYRKINTFILTFYSTILPEKIKVGYTSCTVDPYITNPLRCFNCQLFGHHKDKCKRKAVCSSCGQEGHDDSSCDNPKCCVNCKGDHTANSKDCPKWKLEKEIHRIKCTQNVSFPEARKIAEAQNLSSSLSGPSTKTFATVVTKVNQQLNTTFSSAEVQTDMTWPFDKEMYEIVPSSTLKTLSPRKSVNSGSQTVALPAVTKSSTDTLTAVKDDGTPSAAPGVSAASKPDETKQPYVTTPHYTSSKTPKSNTKPDRKKLMSKCHEKPNVVNFEHENRFMELEVEDEEPGTSPHEGSVKFVPTPITPPK